MDIRYAEPFPLHEWLHRLPLPIWFYRLTPGWILGDRGLLLTHIGRRGLQLRQTLLEVVAHDPATDTYIAAAGWASEPTGSAVSRIGRMCWWMAIAARLSEAEAKQALRDYARRCPSAFRNLVGTMSEWQLLGLRDDYCALAHAIRLIALRPLYRTIAIADEI